MSQEAYVPKDGDYGELSFKPIVGKVSVSRYGDVTIDPEDDRDKWSFEVGEFAGPRSDWVFTPKTPPAPPLPTTPGSVVRNRHSRAIFFRTDQPAPGDWIDRRGDSCGGGMCGPEAYEVLFDAGTVQ